MNPTGEPHGLPPSGGRPAVLEQLNVPGILLMVFGGLAALMALSSVFTSISPTDLAKLERAMAQPGFPAELKETFRTLAAASSGTIGKVWNLLVSLVGALVAFGGFQMRQGRNYGLAMAAAIVGLLPCTSCCCITLPVGVWALVLLLKPEVKAAFV